MTDPIRKQIGVGYKTLVKKTLVQALRSVFTEQYQEEQFRNLRITPEFPLNREHYPCLVVQYNGTTVNNAGVGHEEIFPDPQGAYRWWQHRRFEGSVNLTAYALSPLDRDILSDAIVEVLSFGWLDDIQSEFYDTLYGDPLDPYSSLTLLSQLSVNTDVLSPGGESAGPAPWEPEDTLLYQDSYSVGVNGGFYSALPKDPAELITQIIVQEPQNAIEEPNIYYESDDEDI